MKVDYEKLLETVTVPHDLLTGDVAGEELYFYTIHPETPSAILAELYKEESLHSALACNPNTPPAILAELFHKVVWDEDFIGLSCNPSLPSDILALLIEDAINHEDFRCVMVLLRNGKLSKENKLKLADSDSLEIRLLLTMDTDEDVLRYLLSDRIGAVQISALQQLESIKTQ